ncbi:MAG: helix-turn-helix transcriptional regulator [Candidatus Nanopelagicales bacterium]|nr:helix-turn-helix transcriptional regulator [Candidatus Nanopelagicales bacterium]
MTQLRIGEVASLLGISDDTVRRWCDSGRLVASQDPSGRVVVNGEDLAAFMVTERSTQAASETLVRNAEHLGTSARNRFVGIVTGVSRDGIMAQVEIQSGPHRVVSLMSREAADDLGLEPGVLAVASVKATNVAIDAARVRGVT